MKRAIRRHHKKRLIKARRNYWGYGPNSVFNDSRIMPKELHNVVANTPCLCSCSGCGNPRRSGWESGEEKLTIQERKQETVNQNLASYEIFNYEKDIIKQG